MDTNFGLSQISFDFLYQSYFDSTLLEKAVLDPGSNALIVPSTRQEAENVGFGVALRPESETPIAIEFKSKTNAAKASAILKPGQVLFPNGHQPGDEFRGFSWGLPYGWLGGGLASLVILGSPRARVQWPTPDRDLVIQRQRMAIQTAATALSGVTVPQNWPTRFPSAGTKRLGSGGLTLNASGRPLLQVTPTRVLMRLRSTAALAASTVRFLLKNTHLFDIDSAGASVAAATGFAFRDVDFPAWAMAGADAFATMPQFPAVELRDGPLVTLGCELSSSAGVLAVDPGGGATVGGLFLDIVRFGRL
jgi:hypothetical protein